jgi:hypothetical protein
MPEVSVWAKGVSVKDVSVRDLLAKTCWIRLWSQDSQGMTESPAVALCTGGV